MGGREGDWREGGREKSHLNHLVHIDQPTKRVYDSLHFKTLNSGYCFACRDAILRLLKSNIKPRQDIPEFLTTNLLLIHVIAWDIDWSWKYFLIAQFCSMLIMHNFAQCSSSLLNAPKVSWSPPAATVTDSDTPCICVCQSYFGSIQAVLERCPKSWAIDFAVKIFDCLLVCGTNFECINVMIS